MYMYFLIRLEALKKELWGAEVVALNNILKP